MLTPSQLVAGICVKASKHEAGEQTLEVGATPFGGQVAEAPVHAAATSHPPGVAARHVVPFAVNPFAGHIADAPVHVAATSHPPAVPAVAARHVVPFAVNPFAGHVTDAPVHVAATSHPPAVPAVAARQLVPAASGEQVPTLPGRVQDPQASVQAVLQQMPPTQVKPEAHWLVAPQVPP